MAPLLDEISTSLHLDPVTAGALMTLPVLCFGVFGPAAPKLVARFGMERTLAGVLVALIAGSAIRLLPTVPALFGSTVLVGAAIALGNILLPGLIKRDFPNAIGLMSGVYTLGLTGGAALAAGITVPLARAAGVDWSVALAAWGFLAVIGLVVWLPSLIAAFAQPLSRMPGSSVGLVRDRLAWHVTLFFAFQSLGYYALSAWLPTLLISSGFDADYGGLMLSVINLAGVPPAMVTPILVARLRRQSAVAVGVGMLFAVGTLGVLLAPAAMPVWIVILGIAQGAALGLGLALIVLRSPDAAHATALSGMAQSWGYALAAAGPLVFGALYGATGTWSVPLVFLLIMLLPQTVAGYHAGAPRFVGVTHNGNSRERKSR
jgi:MFS transporter, CP family, cyanate transporter